MKRPDDGFSIGVPAAWNEDPESARSVRALWTAMAPTRPTPAWVYVFKKTRSTVPAEVAAARLNIERYGGTDFTQSAATVAGRDGLRLDFLFPNRDSNATVPMAHDVEFFVPNGRDVLILAVGQNTPQPGFVEQVVASLRVRELALP
ncbi:MAG: hypothetical protein H0U92_14105 [Actinobacteria bacterium]|nr:hypothetical protein [Actinomycetota bacterium]